MERKCASYPILVFEICKRLHGADANKIRRNCSDRIMSRSEFIFHEFLHALKWLIERGLSLRWVRREGG